MANEDERSNPISIPIDVSMFQALESKAVELNSQVNIVMERLQAQLHEMFNTTLDASKIYKESLRHLSHDIETCTMEAAKLISQCDEMDKDFGQLQTLSVQIKTMNKTLDRIQVALRR